MYDRHKNYIHNIPLVHSCAHIHVHSKPTVMYTPVHIGFNWPPMSRLLNESMDRHIYLDSRIVMLCRHDAITSTSYMSHEGNPHHGTFITRNPMVSHLHGTEKYFHKVICPSVQIQARETVNNTISVMIILAW